MDTTDLKDAIILLSGNPGFQRLIAGVDALREEEISLLSLESTVSNPQTLAAVAGAIKAYDAIRALWADEQRQAQEL